MKQEAEIEPWQNSLERVKERWSDFLARDLDLHGGSDGLHEWTGSECRTLECWEHVLLANAPYDIGWLIEELEKTKGAR